MLWKSTLMVTCQNLFLVTWFNEVQYVYIYIYIRQNFEAVWGKICPGWILSNWRGVDLPSMFPSLRTPGQRSCRRNPCEPQILGERSSTCGRRGRGWKSWINVYEKKWIILAVGFLFWEGLSRVFFRPCKIDCTIPVDLMLTIPASLPMSKRWLFFYPSELVKRWNGPPDTEKGEISLEVGSCTYGRSYPKTAWNTGKSRLLNIIINSCLNLQLGWCCCLKIKVMLCLFLGHHLLILKSIFVSTRKMSNLTCA